MKEGKGRERKGKKEGRTEGRKVIKEGRRWRKLCGRGRSRMVVQKRQVFLHMFIDAICLNPTSGREEGRKNMQIRRIPRKEEKKKGRTSRKEIKEGYVGRKDVKEGTCVYSA